MRLDRTCKLLEFQSRSDDDEHCLIENPKKTSPPDPQINKEFFVFFSVKNI